MEADKDYIFINYSRKDLTKVSPIVEEMRANGYNVWYDANIQPGKDWPDYIAAHIKDCAVCVAFHSQASRDSQHCREEIHYALKHKKTVISVYLEDVTLEAGLDMQLARFQSVQYAAPGELLETLRQSPDFERCSSDAPKKRKGVNVRKIGAAFKKDLQSAMHDVLSPVLAVLFIATIVAVLLYGHDAPFFYLDENGVLDIITLPFLEIKMPDYSYEMDSFHPPLWATKRPLVQCAVIRKGVTHIGASAFQDCANMKFVFIPEGVTSIGDKAFLGCARLKELEIPTGVTDIGWGAFSGCTGLESVSFSSSPYIGYFAFNDCIALKQVQLSKDIHGILSGAFKNCTALEEIIIPNSIRIIGYDAFSGCHNLKEVHIQFDYKRMQIVDWISGDTISDSDTLYINSIAFDPGAKIIFEPYNADADVVEYIWGSD